MPTSRSLPSREHIDEVLASKLTDYTPGEPFRVIASLEEAHEAYHAVVVRAGQIIAALYEAPLSLSWRQIDQLMKIEPKTARRWMKLAQEQPVPAADWAEKSFGSGAQGPGSGDDE